MKIIKLAMWVVALHSPACGKATSSAEMLVCNEISLQIQADFINLGNAIPSSWGDLPGVKMIKEGRLNVSAQALRTYNKFAIVPEAPEIQAASGISREYVGMHLFLIQRDPEPPRIYSYTGRAAILIGPKAGAAKERQVMVIFLKETVAEALISQIGGFNPKDQPLAFEENFISKVVNHKKKLENEIEWEVSPECGTRVIKRPEVEVKKTPMLGINRALLCIVASLALFFCYLVWRKFRERG